LRTARPVNKNYRLLNILRTADVNKVVLLSYGRPSSAVAELLSMELRVGQYMNRIETCKCGAGEKYLKYHGENIAPMNQY